MQKYKHPFPNTLRTKEQRKVRICFLRQSGLSHLLAESVSSWRDTKQILFLKTYGDFKKCDKNVLIV